MRLSVFILSLILSASLDVFGQKLPPGPQVATFFSTADDTEQPYGLYIPRGYDERKKYPLVIMLHGAGSNHRLALRRVFGKSNATGETDVEATQYFPEWKDIDYIVASPFARGTAGYQGIPEKDVYDVLDEVKKRFSIDEDRIYLTGLSMGGGGTLWIGLTRPDIWAALAPVCPAPPPGTDNYALNAYNLPMHFYHGDQDNAVPVAVSRDWVKRIRDIGGTVEYDEYPGVQHNSWENAYANQAVFDWFNKFRRNPYPDTVKFSTARYKYNQAYWVRLDELIPGKTGSLEARFSGSNRLDVAVSNAPGFTLRLNGHPRFEQNKPIQLTVNGKKIKVPVTDSISLYLEEGKWINGIKPRNGIVKKAGAEGPIADAFSERHIYVYGTADNPGPEVLRERMKVAEQAANWSAYRNAFLGRIMFFPRVVADKEVRPSDVESSNLILFGTAETNALIARFSDKLPLKLKADADKLSLFYIYPMNGRYVAVNSGLPWWNAKPATTFSFLPQPYALLNRLPDFVLFRETLENALVEGYFDQNWDLSDEQQKKLEASGVQVTR